MEPDQTMVDPDSQRLPCEQGYFGCETSGSPQTAGINCSQIVTRWKPGFLSTSALFCRSSKDCINTIMPGERYARWISGFMVFLLWKQNSTYMCRVRIKRTKSTVPFTHACALQRGAAVAYTCYPIYYYMLPLLEPELQINAYKTMLKRCSYTFITWFITWSLLSPHKNHPWLLCSKQLQMNINNLSIDLLAEE